MEPATKKKRARREERGNLTISLAILVHSSTFPFIRVVGESSNNPHGMESELSPEETEKLVQFQVRPLVLTQRVVGIEK